MKYTTADVNNILSAFNCYILKDMTKQQTIADIAHTCRNNKDILEHLEILLNLIEYDR